LRDAGGYQAENQPPGDRAHHIEDDVVDIGCSTQVEQVLSRFDAERQGRCRG
jgi:hypothetical protein